MTACAPVGSLPFRCRSVSRATTSDLKTNAFSPPSLTLSLSLTDPWGGPLSYKHNGVSSPTWLSVTAIGGSSIPAQAITVARTLFSWYTRISAMTAAAFATKGHWVCETWAGVVHQELEGRGEGDARRNVQTCGFTDPVPILCRWRCLVPVRIALPPALPNVMMPSTTREQTEPKPDNNGNLQ